MMIHTALADVHGFEGTCNNCGKKGHREIDCWEKLSEKRPIGNRRIKCYFCEKLGHKESDCWEKHREKRPDWLQDKDKTERDPINATISNIEVMTSNIEGFTKE